MTIAQRIAAFMAARDVPFYIGLTDTETTHNCVTKSDRLANDLHDLGLKTRQILCTFDWTETALPQHILDLPRDPGETHLFLQIFIPETNSWINCDPTWDNALKPAGFPIAEWDGLNDTILAVKPHVIYSPEESITLLNDENDPDESVKHMQMHHDFYHAINEWLCEKRKAV